MLVLGIEFVVFVGELDEFDVGVFVGVVGLCDVCVGLVDLLC